MSKILFSIVAATCLLAGCAVVPQMGTLENAQVVVQPYPPYSPYPPFFYDPFYSMYPPSYYRPWYIPTAPIPPRYPSYPAQPGSNLPRAQVVPVR